MRTNVPLTFKFFETSTNPDQMCTIVLIRSTIERIPMKDGENIEIGWLDPELADIAEDILRWRRADPDYSLQVAAYRGDELILDLAAGPYITRRSRIVPYSVSKNVIGIVTGILIQDGLLELDQRVAHYWPEFAGMGKAGVTVRQLLSHQAGLPDTTPMLSWEELFDDHAAANRLALQLPVWRPGAAFGYHALTLAPLASELFFRSSGRTLQRLYEEEIRATADIDFYLGLPSELEESVVRVLPIIEPAGAVVEERQPSPFGALVPLSSRAGRTVDVANDREPRAFGLGSVSGVGSARGLADLFRRTVFANDAAGPLLRADVVDELSQVQVHGHDIILDTLRTHGVVFMKPTPQLPFGSHRAFGHDGAAGALAFADPETGLAFAYTVVRAPHPGGADPRALKMALDLRRLTQ
jgi:CubicO group peptidase (beta-lactamase class C family)